MSLKSREVPTQINPVALVQSKQFSEFAGKQILP